MSFTYEDLQPGSDNVPQEIIDRWPSHEFSGPVRLSRFGFKYVEAHHHTLNEKFYYVFGADSFVDRDGILCGAPELIFPAGFIVKRI